MKRIFALLLCLLLAVSLFGCTGGEKENETGSMLQVGFARVDITPEGSIQLGGTVTGGKAPKGSGIYIATNGTVVLSGNVKITGSDGDNLYLGEGGALQIGDAGLGEEAEIGFSCWQTGEFLSEVPEGVDIAKHFTSDDSSRKIVKTGDGTWALK